MGKYYVGTGYFRSMEEKSQSFVTARTGKAAASKVLGGKWKRKKIDDIKEICRWAIVFKLNSFGTVGTQGQLDVRTTRHYERKD